MSNFVALIFCLAIGIPVAFWGYQLHVRVPFLPGLFAGALVGGATGACAGVLQGVIGAVVLGLLCALLTFKKPKTGTFLVLFACGYTPFGVLSATTARAAEGSGLSLTFLIFPIVLGVVLGLLATYLHPRGWVIAATGILGARLLISCLPTETPAPVGVILFLVLVCAAIFVQVKYTGTPEAIARATQGAGAAPADAAPVPPVPTPAARSAVPAEEKAPSAQPAPAPTADVPAAETPAAEAVPATALTVCANCGMPLKPGTKFCPECGQAVDRAL